MNLVGTLCLPGLLREVHGKDPPPGGSVFSLFVSLLVLCYFLSAILYFPKKLSQIKLN